MKTYRKITPEGTRDLLFEECQARRTVERALAEVFSSHGFKEVVTPGLEFYDVFDPESSGISQEEMYKLTDRRGRLIVVRPDATLPIARLTATRLQNLPKPVRLYYTQPVYRSNPNLTGRSDESVQTGIELIGAGGRRADLEALVTAVEALRACLPGFRLEIGHAGFFRALAGQLPVNESQREDIRRFIEAKNYPALDALLDTLGGGPAVAAMRRLPRLFGGEEVLEEARSLCVGEQTVGILAYLQDLYETLGSLGFGDSVMLDLGLVQRNDYYTGVVFSAYMEDYGDAVLLGGRYDHLLGLFGAPMPAVGFAVQVDALARRLLSLQKVSAPPAPEVLVHSCEGFEKEGFAELSSLRAQGHRCEHSVFDTREEALVYARARGVREVLFVGAQVERVLLERGGTL